MHRGSGARVFVGNAALGIAKFETIDTADKTTVIGLDAKGQEVGRLDLVHGQFALSKNFQDDYPGESEVDGRKIDVAMHGQHRYALEKKGYERPAPACRRTPPASSTWPCS